MAKSQTTAPLDPPPSAGGNVPQVFLSLLEMGRRARTAASSDELAFMLVNGTHSLTPYRQAALWWSDTGVQALSGVVQPDHNAPYVDWLKRVFKAQVSDEPTITRIDPGTLPDAQRNTWSEWLPAHGVRVPLAGQPSGALLLARDTEWTDSDLALLQEWCQTWLHAWRAKNVPTRTASWRQWLQASDRAQAWYRRKTTWAITALLLVLFTPVRMTVLAAGEVVPSQPVVVRAPIEGVIERFDVQPNSTVQKGQALFGFDPILIETRVNVARQSLETALAQYRQTSQMALSDSKFKIELASQAGSIEEKRAEFEYLKDQKKRSTVKAPAEGIVLFDDPSSWIGKPVAIGERIMRIAKTGDTEVEAWLPISDAVDLAAGDGIVLYLQADPLVPVRAKLSYFSHDAVERPDGTYAYRIRGQLDPNQSPRVGLKGTAKLSGQWTVLGYWLLRRPIAVMRTTLGL
jgi:HlyD family secretion protein